MISFNTLILSLLATLAIAQYNFENPPAEDVVFSSGQSGTIPDDLSVPQDCQNKDDGLYELAGCSTQFLTCSGGIARIMDCPADLIYDSRIVACEYSYNVPACNGGSGYEPVEETTTQQVETTEELTTEEATTQEVTTEESTTSTEGSAEGSAILPASDEPRAANHICVEDGFYSYGACSDSYTACSNGYSIPMQCPSGLAFDQARQLCDYPLAVAECSNESSGSGSGAETETESSGSEAEYGSGAGYEEPTGCVSGAAIETAVCSSSYQNCVNGEWTVFTCENDLVFSQQQGECVAAETCQNTYTSSPY